MMITMAPMGYSQPSFDFTPTRNDYTTGSIGASFGYNMEALSGQMAAAAESYTGTPENAGINDTFPCKLYLMLSDTEEQGLDHIVAWQPHGRCFVVRNRKEFVKHIMPTYFRMTKFESFQRQLNLYGFNRITTGRDKGAPKGTRVRKPAALEMQPNFYICPETQIPVPRKTATSSNHGIMFPFGAPTSVQSSCLHSNNNNNNNNSQVAAVTNPQTMASSHVQSLVALTKSSSPEAFARMLQSAAAFGDQSMLSATSLAGIAQQQLDQQQHQQQNYQFFSQPSENMAKRLSQLWGQPGAELNASEPMFLRQLQQQQQPFGDDLDRSFDALLAALSQMDPTTSA